MFESWLCWVHVEMAKTLYMHLLSPFKNLITGSDRSCQNVSVMLPWELRKINWLDIAFQES